uniref:Uncharacterized protein n=1 Tax=Meloidogyne enterolobii TaxID=390850 RepID=A0A6V7WWM3_MELEN|nr:unnamed protein product [Meloidogyne enterolobii]
MIWVETNCSCPAKLKCLRPGPYSKPTFCLPEVISPVDFEQYVSNPLQFLTKNCSNATILYTLIFLILVSLIFQLASFAFMIMKKRSRPMTTRQFAAGPRQLLVPTVQPTPLVVDCRKKRTPATEMKLFLVFPKGGYS